MTAHATPEPMPKASEGDIAEQGLVADPLLEDETPGSLDFPLEADPADAFEQQQPVPDVDEFR